MEPILRTTENIDWITLIILFSLLFIVMAKTLFYNRFMSFIILPFNNRYIFIYSKKEKLLNWFSIFFGSFQLINFSLFLFYIWHLFWPSENGPYPFMFLLVLGSVLIFMTLKIFLQWSNGFIFGSGRIISDIIFRKISYLNYSAITMFVANIILTYVLKDSKPVVYLTIFLIILINAIGWASVLKNHQKLIKSNFFYFILYLCALEIAPFVIVGSYLKQ
ncbi:MAG: DUF4271 domain-containing protein [Maribacter sp.]|nr:MAG: DUF4271 domain-containing protein [Maribacter sp.]